METTDFKISLLPDLDESGQEALAEVFAHIKKVDTEKPRKIVLTISVDPISFRILSELEIRLPKAEPKQWTLTTLQGIRENDSLRVEKPQQKELFGG